LTYILIRDVMYGISLDSMDSHSLYIFATLSLAIYTVALSVLAHKNRRMNGIAWFAASLGLRMIASVLQGLLGILPFWATTLGANEFGILSFFAMYMGFRWFVLRDPMRRWLSWLLFSCSFGIYTALCFIRPRHFVVTVLSPGLVFCLLSVWLLLRHGKGSFRSAARVASVALLAQFCLSIYRSRILFMYWPARESEALSDPRLLFTRFAIMLIVFSMVLLYVWFFVIESHHDLRKSALTDALTGIFNRRAIVRESEREISLARRASRPISVIAIDVDLFKSINDRHGHNGGDLALCAVADLLRNGLRQTDLIARLGGEEFAVVLPETNISGALHIAEKLRDRLASTPIALPSGNIQITFTAGVAQLIGSDTNFNSIIGRADKALYRGKAAGRNCVVVAEPHGMPTPYRSAIKLRTEENTLSAKPRNSLVRLCRRLFYDDAYRKLPRDHRITAAPESYAKLPSPVLSGAARPLPEGPSPPPHASRPAAPSQSLPSHLSPTPPATASPLRHRIPPRPR
jgi:diguanylate cyclase (GGDEF)-like protein